MRKLILDSLELHKPIQLGGVEGIVVQAKETEQGIQVILLVDGEERLMFVEA